MIESLLAAAPEDTEANFYRTSAGAEVDLVLTLPGDGRWAIEIKRSSAPKVGRGVHQARTDLKPARAFVVYGGAERFPLDTETEAISLSDLAAQLRSAK